MKEKCYRKYIFRGIDDINTEPKKCGWLDRLKDLLVKLGVARYE